MLKLCLLMAAILDGGRGVTGHNFESILPKDHPCHVCFKLADWFQKRRLLNNFPIGSYVNHVYPVELEKKISQKLKGAVSCDVFNFPIMNYSFLCSNIAAGPAY